MEGYIQLNDQQISLLKLNVDNIKQLILENQLNLKNAKNDFEKQFLTKQIECLNSNVFNILKIIEVKKIDKNLIKN